MAEGFFGILAFLMGFVFARVINKKERPDFSLNPEETKETEEITSMTLRNGYGVTKDRMPTFAEQWVNIMNYSGESQEEDYEETEVDSKNDLERVS